MKLRLLYFAQLREQCGLAQEAMVLDAPLRVADLIEVLRQRGARWQDALAPEQCLCVAVNQEMVTPSFLVSGDAEVAMFRPVTGG